ncbi:MAG TPA: PIG-L deacetylase family protein [Kofleriaceae bacterium]|nr:PIG-L deacetylase family protein [Kofleriaceae bacterium]
MHIARDRRVLAFGAHPDDIEAGAGGLVARFAAAGAHPTMVVTSIPNRYPDRLVEARAGAEALGAELVLLRDDAASRVEDYEMHDLVRRYEEVIARVAPDLVITHGPSDTHWDHFLVHRATLAALRRTRCDVVLYDAGPPIGSRLRTGLYIDIEPVLEKKLAAVAAHATQFSAAAVEGRRDAARATGALCGLRFAEVFEPQRLYA